MDPRDSDYDAPLPGPKQKARVRVSEDEKLGRAEEKAAEVLLAKESMDSYLSRQGTARKKEKGGPRKQRRIETGPDSAVYAKEVHQFVLKGRKMFETNPSKVPVRGSCFFLSAVITSLFGLLITERPDLLQRPFGSTWSAGDEPCIGLMVWLDGRKFPSDIKPPKGLRQWKDGGWVATNEAVVVRLLDLRKPHHCLANILVGNYFIREESINTVGDIVRTMSLNEQLELAKEMLQERYHVPVKIFLCADLHFMRCALQHPAMDRCPFCNATVGDRLLTAIPLSHHLYDSDHLCANLVLAFTQGMHRIIKVDLQYYFQRYMVGVMPSWAASGERASLRWKTAKYIMGWRKDIRNDPTQWPINAIVVEATSKYEFPQEKADKLFAMTAKLIKALHIVTSKRPNVDDFVASVLGINEEWRALFGERGPTALHILEEHWSKWLLQVIAYAFRSEGGEGCNETHADIHDNATTQWVPVVDPVVRALQKYSVEEVQDWLKRRKWFRSMAGLQDVSGPALLAMSLHDLQSIIPAEQASCIFCVLHPPLRYGADTLLEVDVGPWYVLMRHLKGNWPQF